MSVWILLPIFVFSNVIPLCSAFAAQDEGSARQVVRLLYKAGELALNMAMRSSTNSTSVKPATSSSENASRKGCGASRLKISLRYCRS
ncbi:hypothetical protein [Halogranum amylolyticum]|uniref:hypothetical protein n=1 Tax=Halogranum amylolyticum TaxID=660520 RepID=UPI00373FD3D0